MKSTMFDILNFPPLGSVLIVVIVVRVGLEVRVVRVRVLELALEPGLGLVSRSRISAFESILYIAL